ncbi:MAG TPA: sugar ABC transporter ATP-binding protein [Atribacterota bacterium]|nr:sugar ABC transporter ATP-binding protein [Atribacterota bacterium]
MSSVDVKEEILCTKNLSKEFNGVWVLNGINFNLKKGEIHSIVGENGAGKSTFIKILSGVYPPSKGEISISGDKVFLNNVKESEKLGIRTVHQEINLIPFFNVQENIFIGEELEKKVMGISILDQKKSAEAAKKALNTLGVELNLSEYAHKLDTSMRRIVQVCKVLVGKCKVIIFDEPTTTLGSSERKRLLDVILNLKKQDIGIIFISHNIDEVLEISDRITVFRDGENMGTMVREDATVRMIISQMIGHKSYVDFYRKPVFDKDKTVFKVEGLTNTKLTDINLKVYKGEVLGIAGIVGSGKTELARAIFGIDSIKSGNFYINEKRYEPKPDSSVKQGIALVPEERHEQGLVLNMNIEKNISLAYLDQSCRSNVIDFKIEKNIAEKLIEYLKIKTTGSFQIVRYLSGGNQQKVVIGRWLSGDFSLGIFDEPTKGIDIKAKDDIYHQIDKLSHEGKGIIFISSFLPELMNISDRILVMRDGKIVSEFDPRKNTETEIMIAMLGGDNDK